MRNLLIIFVTVLSIGLCLWQGNRLIQQTATHTLQQRAEASAWTWLRFFSEQLGGFSDILDGGMPSEEQLRILSRSRDFVDVFRFKLFNENGHLVLLSDDLQPVDSVHMLSNHNPDAARAIASGKPFTIVKDGKNNPDRPDYYSETYVPVVEQGAIVGVVEVYSDITAAHIEVVESFRRVSLLIGALILAAMSVPVTILIWFGNQLKSANGHLQVANSRAVNAEQAKGQFLANMSHEIRTPMNGIIGMSDLLQSTEMTSDQKTFATTISDSAQSLLMLINDILDLSKIEAGHLSVDNEAFDIYTMTHEVAALLAPVAAAKGLPIHVSTPIGYPCWVLGDVFRLRQCLLNVVGNAVKFSQQGHIMITLDRDADGRIILNVQDTGNGIPQDKLATIFDPFEQSDMAEQKGVEGTGLGLAITRKLVRLMGGTISVTSSVGMGSTFSFSLPLPAVESMSPPLLNQLGFLEDRHVLLIEPDQIASATYCQLLRQLGLRVATADTFAEARETLLAGPLGQDLPAVVLMGEHVSVSQDIDRLRDLVSSRGSAYVPVILLLDINPVGGAAVRTNTNADAVLYKPLRAEPLIDGLCLAFSGGPSMKSRTTKIKPRHVDIPDFSAISILVADDNRTNRLVAKKMLVKTGANLIFCEDGQEAVERFIASKPDIVLMDVSMPRMDGFEATWKILEHEGETGQTHTTIIALTANAMASDRERCLNAGMDDFLAKPLGSTELYAMIARYANPRVADQASA